VGFSFHADADCNRILNFINRDCHDLIEGVSRRLVDYHWSLAGGDETRLNVAYQTLVSDGLIVTTGEHCRLTASGYRVVLDPECAEVEVEAPIEVFRRSGPLTEYALRTLIIDVLHRNRGRSVKLDELAEEWAISGLRAGELRDALDLLFRDQLASFAGLRRRSVALTSDGVAYQGGRAAPAELVNMAPELEAEDLKARSVDSRTLCLLAAYAAGDAAESRSVSFGEISYRLERMKIPGFRVFHAIELAHRLGHLDYDADTRTVHLSNSGKKLYRAANGRAVQWAIGQAVLES